MKLYLLLGLAIAYNIPLNLSVRGQCVTIVDKGCSGAATTGSCGPSSNCGGPVLITTGPDDMQCSYGDPVIASYSTCVPGIGDGQLTTTTFNCFPDDLYTGENGSIETLEDKIHDDPPGEVPEAIADGLALAADEALLHSYSSLPCYQSISAAPPTTAPWEFENNTGSGTCCPGMGAEGDE
jgi:hypothetical protein